MYIYIENPTLIILFIFLSFSNLSLRLTMNDISEIEIDKGLESSLLKMFMNICINIFYPYFFNSF